MGFFDGLGLLFGGLIVFAGCFALLYLPAYLVTMAFTDRCRGSSTAAKVLDALASLGAAYVLIEEDLGAALHAVFKPVGILIGIILALVLIAGIVGTYQRMYGDPRGREDNDFDN